MIYFILLLVIIGALVLGGGAVLGYIRNAQSDDRKALTYERKKNKIAVRALQNIGSGAAGLPALEAQNALSDISDLEIKEIN